MADPHTDALEKRLKIMEKQMRMMQDELARVREEARQPSAKALELEEWVAKVQKLNRMRRKIWCSSAAVSHATIQIARVIS